MQQTMRMWVTILGGAAYCSCFSLHYRYNLHHKCAVNRILFQLGNSWLFKRIIQLWFLNSPKTFWLWKSNIKHITSEVAKTCLQIHFFDTSEHYLQTGSQSMGLFNAVHTYLTNAMQSHNLPGFQVGPLKGWFTWTLRWSLLIFLFIASMINTVKPVTLHF